MTKELFSKVLYFSDLTTDDIDFEENVKKPSVGVLLKQNQENSSEELDDIILKAVYGHICKHPGVDYSPCQKLMSVTTEGRVLTGIWAPSNKKERGLALKFLFPSVSQPYMLPEVPPNPLHIAVAYDAFKAKDVLELSKAFPGEVMKYGFFTSELPENAKLIAKTLKEFESRTTSPTYDEKFVIQLAKTRDDCVEAFGELGPCYKSSDVRVGEMECKIFFPEGYDEPLHDTTIKKKKGKRKKGKLVSEKTLQETQDTTEDLEVKTEQAEGICELDNREKNQEGEDVEDEEVDGEEEEDEDEDENEEDLEEIAEADKATSPMVAESINESST